MSDERMGDIQAAIEAGKQIADQPIQSCCGIPVAIVPEGFKVETLERLLELEESLRDEPNELRGCAMFSELEGFEAHANRFKTPASVIFADESRTQLHAVYDYHVEPDEPRWMRHRASYAAKLSPEWLAWAGRHEKPMSQDDFGTWIDYHMSDIVDAEGYPPAAAVLEMARGLSIRIKGTFERKINPTTGEGTLVSKDEHDTSSTKIPRAFLLGIPVFLGGDKWAIEARVKFALKDGKPVFAYSLHQHDRKLREAFADIRKHASEATGLPVWAGSPEL